MSSKVGHCERVAPSKPPLLTAGNITPDALRPWEICCRQFLSRKEVAAKDQVGIVAWNIQDPRVRNWYMSDCDRLDALPFDGFMKELRSYWLPYDWTASVLQKIRSSMQGDKPFHVWATEVQSQNALLRGEPPHLSDKSLRGHLERYMHIDLIPDYRFTSIADEEDLRKWVQRVRLLDEKRLRGVARQEAVEAALRASGRQPFQNSRAANTRSKNSKVATDGKSRTRVPPLTAEERKRLKENAGCFKCRQFFQSHTTPTCPNNFPDVKRYTTLTVADVEAARTKKRSKLVDVIIEVEPAPKRARLLRNLLRS
ncbi:hypothetical protein V8B97DRAFT_1995826 [Scleroderma yunnanense]